MNEEEKAFGNRIENESEGCSAVKNRDLICKDCTSVLDDTVILGNVSTCKKYEVKPDCVFSANECEGYESGSNAS